MKKPTPILATALLLISAGTAIAGSCPMDLKQIDAALDACSTLATLNHFRRRHGQPPIEFGVGLNIGEVVYGNVGAPDRLDFTVMGPAVNRAARLESLTKTLGSNILFSKKFADLIEQPVKPMGEHEMKGIVGAQQVFALEDFC